MTLPYERARAVVYAQEFLRDLLDPLKTPRVHRAIRKRAGMVLRHYPSAFEMERAKEKDPDTWGDKDKL